MQRTEQPNACTNQAEINGDKQGAGTTNDALGRAFHTAEPAVDHRRDYFHRCVPSRVVVPS